ncbi:MAG: GGDEF domain-containing protein [Acidaminobacteraceae bacterium]
MLKKYRFYVILALFLLVYFSISILVPVNDLRFSFNDINDLNVNWEYSAPTNEITNTNLPNSIQIPVNNEYEIKKYLPKEFSLPQSIRVRSSMQDISVYLDDNILFDNIRDRSKSMFYIPRVSAWFIIDIPEDSYNKVLKIVVSTPISTMSGRINQVYYGHSSDLIGDLIINQKLMILISFLILFIGIFVFIASFVMNTKSDKRLQYLSVFSIAIALWLISEIDIMQFFSANQYFISSVSYVMLPIASISFTLFMETVALKKYSKLLNHIRNIMGLLLVTSIFLQLFMNINYIDSFKVFISIILIEVLLIISLLLFESIKYKDKNCLKYLLITSVLIFTVIIETVNFLNDDFMNVSSISNYGITFFLFLLIVDTLKFVNEVFQKEGESIYLREVAYKDPLTGGLNRAAFEKDMDFKLAENNQLPFRLIMFDLNGFKRINDEYGHNTGDQVLIDFHNVLTRSFRDLSKCYRVGGDEFMIISDDILEETYLNSIDLMISNIEKINLGKLYSLQAAYGSGVYTFDTSFGAFKNDVDSKMYKQKKECENGKLRSIYR